MGVLVLTIRLPQTVDVTVVLVGRELHARIVVFYDHVSN